MGSNLLNILVCLFIILFVQVADAQFQPSPEVFHHQDTKILDGLTTTRRFTSQIFEHQRPQIKHAAYFSSGNVGIQALHPPRWLRRPPVKVKPVACTPPCLPAPCCILPIRLPGQWELSAQAFFARVQGTVRWPATVLGLPASDVDFVDDLGIPAHVTLGEFSARYQFRPNWAVFYSIMPADIRGGKVIEESFWFGSYNFPVGTYIGSKWEFLYQRLGLLYQPIVTPSVVVSLTGAWLFQDQTTGIDSDICGGRTHRVDRTRHMVFTGLEIQKCIQTLPNGGTFSSDNRVGIGFLDDTISLDLQVGIQYSVPLGFGRWGFARGGYRFIKFAENRTELRLDTSLEGGFIEAGFIF